jgi:ankyrin repeat protein
MNRSATNGAMHIAASRNETLELARLATDRRCVEEIFRDQTPLQSATNEHCLEALEMLLRLGANTEVRNSNGETPLYESARMGYMGSISLLVEYGANVDSPAIDGCTALHQSVLEKKIPQVELLIWAGADLSKRNGQNFTPIHLAIIQGLSGMLNMLLSKGADIHESPPRNFGMTCLALAIVCGNEEIICSLNGCLHIEFVTQLSSFCIDTTTNHTPLLHALNHFDLALLGCFFFHLFWRFCAVH